MVGQCRPPYTSPPECNVTWASASQQVYLTTQIIWSIAAVVMWFICLIQLIRLAQNRGWSWNLWFTGRQHQIHGLCFLSATALVIRAPDPMGWNDQLYDANIILQGFGSCCGLALLTLAVTTWAKIIASISGGSLELITWFERWCIFCNFTLLMICFGLQVGAHPTWLFYVIILVFVATYIFINMVFAWIYGYQIHSHLRAFDQHTRTQQRRATNTSPVAAPNMKVNSSNRKRVSVILKLLTVMTMLMIFCIYFEISTTITSLQTRYDNHDAPQDPPAMTWGGMFNDASLTIAQALAIPIAAYAFKNVSPVRSQSSHPQSSHPSNPSSFVELGKTQPVGVVVDGPGFKPISVERASIGSGVGVGAGGKEAGLGRGLDAPVASPTPMKYRTTSTISRDSKSHICHTEVMLVIQGGSGDGVGVTSTHELPASSSAVTDGASSPLSTYTYHSRPVVQVPGLVFQPSPATVPTGSPISSNNVSIRMDLLAGSNSS